MDRLFKYKLAVEQCKPRQKKVFDYIKSIGYEPEPIIPKTTTGNVIIDFKLFELSIALSQTVTCGSYSEFYLLPPPKSKDVYKEIGYPLPWDINRFETFEETCKEIDRLVKIVKKYTCIS